jgi:hypothetical protein
MENDSLTELGRSRRAPNGMRAVLARCALASNWRTAAGWPIAAAAAVLSIELLI